MLHCDLAFSYLLFTLPIFLNKFPESLSYYVLRKQGDKLANILNQDQRLLLILIIKSILGDIRGIFLKKRFYDIGTYPKVQKMVKKAE